MTHPTAPNEPAVRTALSTQVADGDQLGDRLRRLAPWADRVPTVHHIAVAVAIDKLAVLLGMAVADAAPADEDDR